MAFETRINESIRGRNLGFEFLSSGFHGTQAKGRFLVGPEAARISNSTADTTGTNIKAYGYSVLTTAVSSGVYVLDPPIPGVEKTIAFHTTGANPIYVKAAGSETFCSTQTTTGSLIASSQTAYAVVKLMAISTAIWGVVGSLSSAYLRASGTT